MTDVKNLKNTLYGIPALHVWEKRQVRERTYKCKYEYNQWDATI